MITYGTTHIFGIVEPLPMEGFPPGKIRIRMRAKDIARAFVRTQDGIRGFYIKQENGKWKPGPEFGRNMRPKVRPIVKPARPSIRQ